MTSHKNPMNFNRGSANNMLEEFDAQLKNLSRGLGFMDKEALLFHELDLQIKIYSVFIIIGIMMTILGIMI